MAGFTGFRGKTFPALTSKLALAEQSRGGALGALRRSGTPLAICFSTQLSPTNLPATSPESVGGFLQRFHRPRSRRRSPDTLIRAPPALDSALASIARPPKKRSPTSTLQQFFTRLRSFSRVGCFIGLSCFSRSPKRPPNRSVFSPLAHDSLSANLAGAGRFARSPSTFQSTDTSA